MCRLLCLLVVYAVFGSMAELVFADDFFYVSRVDKIETVPSSGAGIWVIDPNSSPLSPGIFQPCISADVYTSSDIESKNTKAKAYFFDKNKNLLATADAPSLAIRGRTALKYSEPIYFRQKLREKIFFQIPPSLVGSPWIARVIFGDSDEVAIGT